jgi:hypothetical protein
MMATAGRYVTPADLRIWAARSTLFVVLDAEAAKISRAFCWLDAADASERKNSVRQTGDAIPFPRSSPELASPHCIL